MLYLCTVKKHFSLRFIFARINMATPLLVNKKVVFLAQSSLVVLLMLYFILPIRNVVFPSWFNGAWQEISTSEVLRMRNAAKSRRLAVLEEVCPTKRSPGITLNDVDKKKIHDYSYLNTPQFRKKVAENGHAMFMSVMSLERKHNYLHLYKVFAARLYSKNISFFVNSGTVLGAYRHGGFIPWDDDLDVGVDIAELGTLHSLLTCMEGFQFTQYRRSHWKFRHAYREDERPLDLDVFFYETNDKYIWSNTQILVDNFIFRRRDAFPLGQALFEGIRMPMPGELTKSVTREFNVNICYCKENKRHRNNTWWALQYSADAFSKTSVECKEIAYMYDMNLDTGA